MSGTIKLTYFDARARGEISRLVMAAGKKKFEDVRVTFDQWPELKKKNPFGAMPVLEVGGKQFCQGLAIATYLAKECGLYGKTNLEQLMIDMIAQLREDLLIAETKMMFAKEEEKAEIGKKLMEETYPKYLGLFTNFLKENKTGFAVGKQLSLADIVIFEGTQGLSENHAAVLDKYPEIKALREKVAGTARIKEYLAKRKPSMF